MAPSKKEKIKIDFDSALFACIDKRECLNELLESEGNQTRKFGAETLKTGIEDLTELWQQVLLTYKLLIDSRNPDDEAEALELVSSKAEYKAERNKSQDFKHRLIEMAKLQQVADSLPVVPDKAVQIAALVKATELRRTSIKAEVAGVEQTIANLQPGLTTEMISLHRANPERIKGALEDRLLPLLEDHVKLEPDKADTLQAEHFSFIGHQQNSIDAALALLFSKLAVHTPDQQVHAEPTPPPPASEHQAPDKAVQMAALAKATEHRRTSITSEVAGVEQSIANLQPGLSPEMISLHRGNPERIKGALEEKLLPLLEEHIKLEPDKADTLQAGHFAFIAQQQSQLDAALVLLFSKLAGRTPGQQDHAPPAPSPQSAKLQLEKLKPPTFDGDHTKWLLFKAKFRDIVIEGAGYSDTQQGHVLRTLIPAEALERVDHLKLGSEIFTELDEMYGDTATSVSILVNKLLNLKLCKVADYDQVLEMCTAVNKNNVILSQLDSEASNHVKYNTNILAHLVDLLPGHYLEKWFDYKVLQPKTGNDWDMFTKWLKDMEKRANAQKLAKLSKADSSGNFAKGKHEHPKPRISTHGTKVTGPGDIPASTCPVCKVHHMRGDISTSIIMDCPKWRELKTVDEKARLVESMAGCKRCLRWNHKAGPDCSTEKGYYFVKDRISRFKKFTCGKELPNGERCRGDHSIYLCGTTVQYCCLTKVSLYPGRPMPDPAEDQIVLLPIQEVDIQGEKVQLFWDDGSTATLCTYTLADQLGLRGSPVHYSMQTVDSQGWVQKEGKVFLIKLVSNTGVEYTITAYGVDSIADCCQNIKVDEKLKKVVSEVPSQVWNRPKGEVGLLIGSNLTHLMPKDCYEVDNLRIKSSQFGSGFCLQGTSRAITLADGLGRRIGSNSAQLEELDYAPGVRGARIQTMRVEVHDESILAEKAPQKPVFPSLSPCLHLDPVISCSHVTLEIPFLEAELDGVAPPRRCRRCRQCKECSDRNLMHTEIENAQLEVIESKVKLDLDKKKINVEYPFTTDPAVLGNSHLNNRRQAIAVQRSVENSLLKKGLDKSYNAEFQKMIDRGTISLITPEALAAWQGAVNYVTHHGVINLSSSSTPHRIVSNSALINRTCGKSLNQILMKGPNCLNNLNKVLIRFRSYDTALLFDLSKAYNHLFTGLIEKFIRLIVWRDCDSSAEWRTYGFECTAFGDLSAAVQLEVAKKLCAEAGIEIDQEASDRIKHDTYVDDGATGGDAEQVSRFRGQRDADGKYNGTIPQILGLGGLDIKAMMVSGEEDQEAIDKLGKQVLGIDYDVGNDEFLFPLQVHVHPKKHGVRAGDPVTLENISDLDQVKLTPRILTGLVNSFYDPLGLTCIWLIKFKLLLKKLTLPEYCHLSWDDVIPDDLAMEWKSLIVETLDIGTVRFPRAFRPKNAVGNPEYIGFWDGSLLAWACAVYCRYALQDGGCDVRLVAAKVRVSPSKGTSVPKVEVSGLLDLSRLMGLVVEASSQPPANVTLIGDSECSIAMMEKSGSSLAPYFCNRVGEIRSNLEIIGEHCPVEPLQHVSGNLNPSDLPTRGLAHPEDLMKGSVWQRGPDFLHLPREEWPVSREFVNTVPVEASRVKLAQILVNSTAIQQLPLTGKRILLIILTLSFSDSILKVTAIVARTLIGWTENLEQAKRSLTILDLQKAKQIILLLSQLQVRSKMQDRGLDSLNPEETSDGIIVTRGRLGQGMKAVLGQESLPIITPATRLAKLIMWAAHREMHRATPAETAARSRKYAWILQAKQLAISICKRCTLCRQIHIKLGKQIMGDRKPEHLLQAPPFTYTACDLLGPYKCRSMVNSRSLMKVWGGIYICQGTGAVRIYLCPGYDTKAFITAHDKFLAHCGNPKTITSDCGSQLRKVSKVLDFTEAENPANWDWRAVQEAGARLGTEWIFIPPGTQWRNRAEAAVKVMKRTLDATINSQEKLNFSELESALMSAANMMNERPLTVRVYDDHTFHPLTVNQLLLGRTTTSISSQDYQAAGSPLERLQYREEVEAVWWNQFSIQVLPTLVPFTKWKDQYPNRQVGDIVLIHYPGLKKAEYRLAKVNKVMPDDKGNVRTMEVLMRPRDKRTDKSARYTHKDLEPMKVPVQRTALLMPCSEIEPNQSTITSASTQLSSITPNPSPSLTLACGDSISGKAALFVPAMQISDYSSYEATRRQVSDMQCISSPPSQISVWK